MTESSRLESTVKKIKALCVENMVWLFSVLPRHGDAAQSWDGTGQAHCVGTESRLQDFA